MGLRAARAVAAGMATRPRRETKALAALLDVRPDLHDDPDAPPPSAEAALAVAPHLSARDLELVLRAARVAPPGAFVARALATGDVRALARAALVGATDPLADPTAAIVAGRAFPGRTAAQAALRPPAV